MKTIDVLVEELPKRGGWPDGAIGAGFLFGEGTLYFWDKNNDCPPKWTIDTDIEVEDSDEEVSREQYEAALAEKEHPLPWDDNCNDDDGWIDWAGGKPPVDNATVVDLKFRAGEIASGVEAGKYYWPHTGYEHDIVAYRICSEQAAEAEEPLTGTGVDGWIDWPGGECPVEGSTLVEVKYRNELPYHIKGINAAGKWNWRHDDHNGDIIAYRLHQPQEAEQAEADDEADLNECIGQDAAPVWNGEGLPPVGMEIEYKFAKVNYRTDFSRGKVLAYGMHNVFMEHWASKNEFIQPLDKIEFRPIRSEADRKRDEAVQALCDAGGGNGKVDEKAGYGSCWFDVYDAIAAGKIPGVKLED